MRRHGGGITAIEPEGRPRGLTAPLLVVASFIAVHVLYGRLGLRFDVSSLADYLQYADPALLRGRLLETLTYLHTQPPLFNLFLGLVLKAFPHAPEPAFLLLFEAFGLVISLLQLALMRRLGVSDWIAVPVTVACFSSPAFMLHEHFLFYPLPLAALLVASAWLLTRFLDGGRALEGLGFVSCLAVLCGIWGVFHLVYFLAVVGFVAWRSPERRRTLARVALVPLLLVAGLYVKNGVLFGSYGPSTWLGMNVWMVATDGMRSDELAALHAAGRISAVSLIGPFRRVTDYPPPAPPAHRFERVPVLHQIVKSTGHINANHIDYVAIGNEFRRDAVSLIRHDPRRYVLGVAHAWFVYFESAGYFKAFRNNAPAVSVLNERWDRLVYGRISGAMPFRGGRKDVWVVLLVGLPAVFVIALWAAARSTVHSRLDPTQRTLLLYLCLQIGFVAVVSNLMQVGENNRFRFITDPLSVVLLGFALTRMLSARAALSRRT